MKKSLLFFALVIPALAQQVPLEDFKCATGTVTASPSGGPTTIQCLDGSGNPQASGFPTTTHIMLWGATGNWKPLNTQTPQYLKMVVNATDTNMYLTDTNMMENTVGSHWQIFQETSDPVCASSTPPNYSLEVVTLNSIVNSRQVTVTRSTTTSPPYGQSALASPHCNEDFFWGPLERSVTWTITNIDATHFSVPLDSSSFGSFTGQTIHINRASSNAQYTLPFLISSESDGNAPALEINSNNYLTMTIDSCPSTSNAITCSFGYSDIFNIKSYYDAGTTSSLVVSGGTGTFTMANWTNNITQFSRTLQANELAWLWNFNDDRVNRPWVISSVSNLANCKNSTGCTITINNMGTGQGGTGHYSTVPDGTYTVTGTGEGGHGFYFPMWADYYSYWGPGPATPSVYNFEFPNSMVKGTYNAANNRFRAWHCWGITGTAQPLEFGSYATLPSTDFHGYHQIAYDTYGSNGACQWQLWEIDAVPYHWVGGGDWFPQGADATWTGWVGYLPYSGGQRHYFDSTYDFYMNLVPVYSPTSLAQTSYIGPMYMDDVAAEPDEWAFAKAATYNPGSGTFRLNVVGNGETSAWGPCSSLSAEFYNSTSELKALGLTSATYQGISTGVSYGGYGALQMNLTTSALPYGNMYFGIRPHMCVSGVSGNGASVQISFRQDPNMQVGDHVTVTGVGGNTNANQTNVAITAVTPRQFWYRSNQGFIVSPTTLTGITVTGGNTCTVNFTVQPNVFVGQEVGLTGFQTGVNLSPGTAGMNWATVASVGTNSFTIACPGSTNGTYNGDYSSAYYLGVVADPAVTLSGTGNSNWNGSFSGTMVSTENNKNFSEISFLPPAGASVASNGSTTGGPRFQAGPRIRF